jgi:hypothetical protein
MPKFWLIVLTGFGIHLPYLTITTSVFERMISITKIKANVGFLMYIVDSIGYLGYNVLLLRAGFLFPEWNIPNLFFLLDKNHRHSRDNNILTYRHILFQKIFT